MIHIIYKSIFFNLGAWKRWVKNEQKGVQEASFEIYVAIQNLKLILNIKELDCLLFWYRKCS
jgi:hypothetical protein